MHLHLSFTYTHTHTLNTLSLTYVPACKYTNTHKHTHTHTHTLPSLHTHPAQAVSKQWKDNNSLLALCVTQTRRSVDQMSSREAYAVNEVYSTTPSGLPGGGEGGGVGGGGGGESEGTRERSLSRHWKIRLNAARSHRVETRQVCHYSRGKWRVNWERR